MDKKTEGHFRRALLAAASVLVGAGAAHAAPKAADPTTIQEVVVPAERRSESLQNVPIAITAATGEEMAKRGLSRLEDINRIAPAVSLSRIGIFMQPVIRGVTTNVTNFGENNIAIYLDGFYIPSSRGLNLELANLRQVEVLKGPQGTLFGRNATGGAILVQTLDPSLTERSGRVMGQIGNFSDKRAQLYFSTPISDTLAFNFAGSYHKSHSYLKDIGGFDPAPIKLYSARAKLLFQPTDKFTAIAALETSEVSDGRANAPTGVAHILSKLLFPTVPIATGVNQTSYSHQQINEVFENIASLKMTYDLGFAKLSSYSFRQLERSELDQEAADLTPAHLVDSYLHERWNTFTQEFNLTSAGEGPLQYVLGAYYFHAKQKSPYDSVVSVFGAPLTRSSFSNQATKAYAVYGDGTYKLGDNLFLTAGLRYSTEEKVATYFEGSGVSDGTYTVKSHSLTPRGVIRYAVDDRSNVYGSVSKGFKSGFVNANAPFSNVRPEKITAYEVGYKTAQRSFRFDAAAYYYDYTDLQVSTVFINPVTNVQNSLTTNAATAKIYGAEIQLTAQPLPALNVTAGLGYTHARYGRYTNATVNVLSAAGLNTTTCGTTLCTQDWSGLRMARSPDWTANLGVDYTIPLSFGDLVLAGNASYQSFFLPSRSDKGLNGTGYRYGQPATGQLSLQAAWNSPDHRWKLTVYGDNLFNTNVAYSKAGQSFGDTVSYNWPRTYGTKIEYNF